MASTRVAPTPQQSTPEEFSCPACLTATRFEPTEELQRCGTCGAFHKTNDLAEGGFTL